MGKRNIFFYLMFSLCVAFQFSCETKKSTQGAGTDSLMINYQVLVDSVQTNWEIMISDDDDKHVLMKRLLLEISYTNNYDKGKFEQLNESVDQLKKLRYDQITMSNSQLIDAYDSATMDLTDQIIHFARTHPRYADYPMMEELVDDINAKNNYILMHRIHYDSWVKELNSFKENNAEKLNELDPSVDMEGMPLFQLSS